MRKPCRSSKTNRCTGFYGPFTVPKQLRRACVFHHKTYSRAFSSCLQACHQVPCLAAKFQAFYMLGTWSSTRGWSLARFETRVLWTFHLPNSVTLACFSCTEVPADRTQRTTQLHPHPGLDFAATSEHRRCVCQQIKFCAENSATLSLNMPGAWALQEG